VKNELPKLWLPKAHLIFFNRT